MLTKGAQDVKINIVEAILVIRQEVILLFFYPWFASKMVDQLVKNQPWLVTDGL